MSGKAGARFSQARIVAEVEREVDFKNAVRYRGLTIVEVYTKHWGAKMLSYLPLLN